MDATRRTSNLRRVATMASLTALVLVPAGQAEAAKKKKVKLPVITSVKPLKATVGDTLTIKGRNFRKGKGRDSVGFKRAGSAVVFVKSDLSTKSTMTVKLPAKLEKVMYGATQHFRLRVLARRFGKSYTPKKLSPTVSPRPAGTTPGGGSTTPGGGSTPGSGAMTDPGTPDPHAASGDCDGDGILNGADTDDDNDLLPDTLENTIGTDSCMADTDGDGVSDAYEYKSAVDLNDDEYQQPNTSLPYPGARPYPNPLNQDAGVDYDGDSLTLADEYALWDKQGGRAAGETDASFAAKHLSYSDGLQYSVYENCPSPSNPAACGPNDGNRRVPTLKAVGYDKQAAFLAWAGSTGYSTVMLKGTAFDIRDVDLSTQVGGGCRGEQIYYDYDCDGYLSDDERDEDADGLTNYDEAHGRMLSSYWTACYSAEAPYGVAYAGTDLANADSDGDGIRDGADDQDHDDIPNMMELSRMDASHANDTNGQKCTPATGLDPKVPNHPTLYGKVNPFNPCDPDPQSRTCERHPVLGAAADPDWWALQ